MNSLSFIHLGAILGNMAKSCFKNARISGLVACIPRREKSIDDEVELFGGNVRQVERLKKTIGLNKGGWSTTIRLQRISAAAPPVN